jgi:hypothetical protein
MISSFQSILYHHSLTPVESDAIFFGGGGGCPTIFPNITLFQY